MNERMGPLVPELALTANTVASLFYYLRWIAPVFLPGITDGRPDVLSPAGAWSAAGGYAAAAGSVALGIAGGVALRAVSGTLVW